MDFKNELNNRNTNELATTTIDTAPEIELSQTVVDTIQYNIEKQEHIEDLTIYADKLDEEPKEELLNRIQKNTFIFDRIDVDKFVANNWLEVTNNTTLNKLNEENMSIWLNTDGDYSSRMSPDGIIKKMISSKLKKVLSSKLKRVVSISEEPDSDIKSFDLLLVSNDVFDPQQKSEFFEKHGEIYRNSFRPTPYMELDKSKSFKKPIAITKLIQHLVKRDEIREQWFMNWLAYFFQELKKSPVALFLKGAQGAGKGVFYDDIIVPLFGKKQCIQVNDKTMKGDFLGGIVEGRLVMNLDEISSGIQNNKEFKNQLKALISNRAGTFQKKFVNTESETKLHAMILITSNEPKALEVEHKDRRLTIFETGGNIANENFLGYGSYKALIKAVTDELEDFALMLLQYPVDVKMATTAMDTPEKEALVGVSSNRFKSFSNAVKSKNLEFFTDLEDTTYNTYYSQLEQCYNKERLSRKMLKHFFAALYGQITTNALLEQLRAIDPIFWNEDTNSVKASNGDYLFKLDSVHNDCYSDSGEVHTPTVTDNKINIPLPAVDNNITFAPVTAPVPTNNEMFEPATPLPIHPSQITN